MYNGLETICFSSEIEQIICEQVRQQGVGFWATTDVETFKSVKIRLEKQNIKYSYLGTWKPKQKIIQTLV